jgi:hypothetical protein
MIHPGIKPVATHTPRGRDDLRVVRIQPRDPSWHKASRYAHSAGGTTSASSALQPRHPSWHKASRYESLSSLKPVPSLAQRAPSSVTLRFAQGKPSVHHLRTVVLRQPSSLSSQVSALSPQPSALSSLKPQPSALKSQPSALKPQPSSLSSLSPQPSALSSLSPLSIPRSAQNQAHTIEPQVRLGDMPRHIGDHIFGNLDLLLTHIRVHLTQLL